MAESESVIPIVRPLSRARLVYFQMPNLLRLLAFCLLANGNAALAAGVSGCGPLDNKTCFMRAVEPLKSGSISRSAARDSYNKLAQLCVKSNNARSCEIAVDIARDMLRDGGLALDIYQDKCESGFAQYCAAAIEMLKDPRSEQQDLALARSYAVKGCAAKDAYLCLLQGDLYFPKEGSPIDWGKLAQEGYYLACRFGKGTKNVSEERRANACSSAYYMGGDSYELNPNSAYRQYGIKQACGLGARAQCERALYGFRYGRMGLERNVEEAGLIAEHMCVQGNTDSCGQASKIWKDSGQVARAVKFADLLCEKHPSGKNCAMSFHIAYEIHGEDADQTVQAATVACNRESGDACWYLAARGDGYQRGDNDDAYSKACKYGIQSVCEHVQSAKQNFAIEDRNAELRRQQAEQKANDDRNARIRQQQVSRGSFPSYTAAGSNYWSNWKPSYCSNYTRGMYTSKSECAN